MKLFLSLLVMALAIIGLIYILKPEKKKTPQKQLRKKPAPPLPPSNKKKQTEKPAKASTEEQLPREPTMEEIRFAVRKYVNKFPGITADVMQDWMKKP